jgi:Carbohydrate binding domain.
MNQKDSTGGWQVGECIEAEELLLDFSDMFCLDALTYIAEKFNTEWEVSGKTIHIRKVERAKDSPLPLAYGKGNGLLSGIERTNYKGRIGQVRIKTSDRNISRIPYGSSTLKMPKKYTITCNGVDYVTDASGSRLMRKTPLFKSPIIPTETLDLTHIYPKRVGVVSDVITVDEEGNLYDIVDIDNSIDFSSNIIPGEAMTIRFQSGQLAGREFDVMYIHEDRRFELMPLTEKGNVYPTRGILPAKGDKYAVFHISLPQEYVTAAEMEVLNAAAKFLYENELPHFSYKATLDKVYAKAKWEEINHYFNPGYFVRFSEPQHLPESTDIRIVTVKEYLNSPYMPEIELSNSITGKTIGSVINQLTNTEQTIERKQGEALSFTKRRFRDAQQSLSMLQNAVKGYSEGINPAWIHSMAALFGDETLQFRFVNNKTRPETVGSGIAFDNTTKVLTCPTGIIQHMSLGINSLSPSHAASEYTFFDVGAFSSGVIGRTEAMYLYAKCNKVTKKGEFLLSANTYDFDNPDGHYYLIVGTLSDEYDNYRSYIECYGFTEILPGRITLWKIVDPDGFQFWDMQNKAFRIGNEDNYLAYNVDGLRRIMTKGILIQSPSGDVSPIGVLIGVYSSSRQYYEGDEVTYNGSTYRALRDVRGVVPTNTTSWIIIAQRGTNGNDGQGYSYIYSPTESSNAPSRPSGTGASNTPSGWWTSPHYPSSAYRYIYVSQSIYANGTWSAWSTPTIYSRNEQGLPGALPTMRQWTNGTTYYRNEKTVDYIVYRSSGTATPTWWRIREGYTSVRASSAPNTNYFEQISSFEAIATTVLLAEQANLAEFIFKEGQLVSQNDTLALNGRTGVVRAQKIVTPFVDISFSDGAVANLDNNFNIATSVTGYDKTILLPSDSRHDGVRCMIFNSGLTRSAGSIRVRTQNDLPLLGSQRGHYGLSYVDVGSGYIGEFQCVANSAVTYWICLNHRELTGD